ncbi:MAG: PEGA domain-containing protein [Polyangiaceae bacterium]
MASPPESEAPGDPNLEEAKRVFHQGNELRKAGDWQGALQRYQRSRALVRSLPNTLNAAICLEQLGRTDEALELYEHALADFPGDVTDDVRRGLAATMSNLRRQVGSLDVSANVDGSVIVDGRMRERVPLLSPLRVLPGARRVVVIKDGYEPFEKTVEIAAGATTFVEARLRPLGAAGRLRVDEPTLAGGDLSVDGAVVGQLPWEGSLSAGDHVVSAEKDDHGSPPRRVAVIAGRTVHLPLRPQALGSELRGSSDPATAEIWVDGVRVSRGSWRGRLPLGSSTLEAREAGYFPGRTTRTIVTAPQAAVAFELRADEAHPRWRVGERGHLFLEVVGGPAIGHSLGSGAEAACDERGCEQSAALGVWAAGRAGYELHNGISFDLALGYLRASTDLSRAYTTSYRADLPETPSVERQTVTYQLDDSLLLSGPFVLGGVGYRVHLVGPLDLSFRLEGGALLATGSDTITGQVSDGAGSTRAVDITVETEDGNTATSAAPLLVPELGLQVRVGPLRFGAGLTLVAGLADGPALRTGETQVRSATPCQPGNPASLDCAPREGFVRGETAFGRFLLWVPRLGARLDL